MATIQQVRQGETIVLTASFTDKDNTLVDPSISKQVRIANPANTLEVTDQAMATDGVTGKWIYKHQVAAADELGEWTFECIGKDGATPDVSMGEGSFKVIKRIGT